MGPPPWTPTVDPGQLERDRRFGRWSQRVVLLVLALTAGAITVQGSLGTVLGGVVVAAVIVMPCVRIVWLLAIWVHQRDRRFIWFGIALLTMIVAGIVAAALRGR